MTETLLLQKSDIYACFLEWLAILLHIITYGMGRFVAILSAVSAEISGVACRLSVFFIIFGGYKKYWKYQK